MLEFINKPKNNTLIIAKLTKIAGLLALGVVLCIINPTLMLSVLIVLLIVKYYNSMFKEIEAISCSDEVGDSLTSASNKVKARFAKTMQSFE